MCDMNNDAINNKVKEEFHGAHTPPQKIEKRNIVYHMKEGFKVYRLLFKFFKNV